MAQRRTVSPPITDLAKQAHDAVQTLQNSNVLYPEQPHGNTSPVMGSASSNASGATTQPGPSVPLSVTNSNATHALPRSSTPTASDKLAGINEMVNRILAPVHALEALKLTSPGTPQNQSSNFTVDANSAPSFATPQMPNTDPLPLRGGGRRARGMRRRVDTSNGTITLASNTLLTPPSFTQRGRGSGRGRGSRGGRGRSGTGAGKRRRTDDTVTLSDSDESENFTPLAQSSSGRKIINANPAPVVIKIEDKETTETSPLAKRPSNNPLGRGAGKKSISFRRTPGGPGAVCKNCGRGHSPSSNAIVFCDGCNTPWHQICHDPPIGKEIVLIAEKEWFCSDCIVMKEEKSRLQGKIAGENLSMLEKRRYLQSLPSKELVSLLLHACRIHPDLPVFTPASNGDGADGAAEEYYEDEDLLPYPKAGNGVSLKPEKERLNLLLDDDFEVFSHSTSGIAEMVAATAIQARAISANGQMVSTAA